MTQNNYHESADIWRRIAALIYDSFILLALSMAYGALALAGYKAFSGEIDQSYTPVLSGLLFQGGWYLSLAMFYFYFWHNRGQTIGMRAWRLKLVGQDGKRASYKSCAIRVLISPFLICLFFIAYLWKFFDPRGLCLHDRLSATKVVVLSKA